MRGKKARTLRKQAATQHPTNRDAFKKLYRELKGKANNR